MNDYLTLFTEQKKTKKVPGIAPSLPSLVPFDGNDGDSLSDILKNLYQKAEFKNCPTCSRQLTSSGKYHFWCASGHYDLHEVILGVDQANYCRFCHDPLRDGVCKYCLSERTGFGGIRA